MGFWDTLTQSTVLASEAWEWDGTTFRKRTYEQVVENARHVAAGLRRLGVGPGSTVAAVITNSPDAISGFIGVWFAGATLASVPIIARGMSVANYVCQLRSLCQHLDAHCLLAEERFLRFMPPGADLGVDIVGYRSLVDTQAVADIEPPAVDDTIFVQFSSGTTAEPRGVNLSGRAIEAQLKILADHIGIDPKRDIGYTWLPLSHDMGFFGCVLLAWYTGMPGVISSPDRFLQAPHTWFDDCAAFGATVTAGPPLALDIAGRTERVKTGGRRLALRMCLVGAEQIGWSSLTNAAEVFAPRGLQMATFTPAYGLAEATLAVTFADLEKRPAFIDVDGEALAEGIFQAAEPCNPSARRLVSVGKPVSGAEVRIDADNHEVLVRSAGLMSGYCGNPALTDERLHDGELRTCDVGFLWEDELYIIGRTDDLLIVGGRNIFVHELEMMIALESSIRKGNCALIDTPAAHRNRIVLVAETTSLDIDPNELASYLRRLAREQSGLVIDQFVFLPVGTFPKTPSGKVQRYRCRQLVEDTSLGVRVSPGAFV